LLKDELVSFVNEEFKKRQEERRPFELRWRLNIAFLKGQQYLEINTAAYNLDEVPKLYEWQEREVFDHISPIIETRIARLSRMRPIIKVRPGSDSTEDLRSAKVGSALLRNIYNEQGVKKLIYVCYPWLEVCGSVFFKNCWDYNKGEIKFIIQEGKKQEVIKEGDLEITVVPAPEIFPDSCYNTNIDNCRSIIHAKAYHVDDIEDYWGKKVKPEDVTALQLGKTTAGAGSFGFSMSGFNYSASKIKNHAIVKEYWEKPSKKHPKGRLIIVAGGQLLEYKDELPFKVGENFLPALPFTKVDCIPNVGEFFGKTIIERIIPIQRRYNAIRNRKAEFLNRAAIGQWAVEEGSVDEDTFEETAGAAGSIHVYKRGTSPPQMIKSHELPSAYDTEEARLLEEFSMLSGVSEISRMSSAPPGVKSGVALQIALEQDDTRLATTASNIEQFLIENGKQWLRLYKQFVSGTRTLRIIGEDNYVEVLDWTNADIQSDDVVVEAWSALAESPAQRRQMVFDLLNTALFQDPDTGKIDRETIEKIFEMLEFGNWETANKSDKLHISKAERENRALSQGEFIQPVSYDDQILHISRHNKFRLTVEYEKMLQEDPELDRRFQRHVDMHLQLLALEYQQQQGGGVIAPAFRQQPGNNQQEYSGTGEVVAG